MNSRGVATLVRGWVGLYTRGMPAAERAARRDAIDDDLWCQHQEAVELGRAEGSVSGEMLLRLLFGIPADISWRLSNRSRPETTVLERSSSMGARVIGILAIVGGASLTVWVLLFLYIGESAWTGPAAGWMILLSALGAMSLLITAIGLVWRFQEHLRAVGIGGAVAVAIGAFAAVPVTVLSVLLPIGSTMLVWDLARFGAVHRWVAVVHAVSGVALAVGYIGVALSVPVLNFAFALAIAYLPSWIAIGASLLLRSVPRAIQPAESSAA